MTQNGNKRRPVLQVALIAVSALIIAAGCQFLAKSKSDDTVLAKTSSAVLTLRQVDKIMPANLKGDDSVQFLQNYVDKWIHNQLMLERAIRALAHAGFTEKLFTGINTPAAKGIETAL